MQPRYGVRRDDSVPDFQDGKTKLTFLAHTGLTNVDLFQWMVCCMYALHAADGAMLPAVFKALEESIKEVSPVSLSFITMLETLFHSLTVMIWGQLGDRFCKLALLAHTQVLWGILTLATAMIINVASLAVVRALAGVIGAALGPISHGLIGVVFKPTERGRAFGLLMASGQLGAILGIMLAGSTSHVEYFGGWRGAYVFFSIPTLVLGWAIFQVRVEAANGFLAQSRTWAAIAHRQREVLDRSVGDTAKELLTNWRTIFTTPSFIVLVLQGSFASSAVKALSYMLFWLQYLGFSDVSAAFLTATVPLGSIFGALLGGWISDRLAVSYPAHGRITFAQLSDTARVLVLVLLFVILGTPEPTATNFVVLWVLCLLLGFFLIMAYANVIKPMFVEIVPSHLICEIIGLSAAIDGVVSSFCSTPLVAYMMEHQFGYQVNSLPIAEMSADMRQTNAIAVAKSTAVITISCTSLTIVCFSILHLTYPKDRMRWADPEEDDPLPQILDREVSPRWDEYG